MTLSFGLDVAIAPDGSSMILPLPLTDGRTGSMLGLKQRGSADVTPIEGRPSYEPVYSPDGAWIAYRVGDELFKRPLTGGPPVALEVDAPADPVALAWLDDGTILYERRFGGAIVQIPDDGGEGRVVFQTGFEVNWVRGLPGARAALVGLNDGSVYAVDLRSPGGSGQSTAPVPLLDDVRAAWYAATGHLVYVRDDGSVFAAPFDPDALEITAGETPLFSGVRTSILNGRNTADMQLGDDGTLMYLEGASASLTSELVLVDRTGREEPLEVPARAYLFPRYSPDGGRLAFALAEVDTDLWVLDLARLTSPTRVTTGGDNRYYPIWSHDGQWLTFTNDAAGGNTLIRAAADGSGRQDTLHVAEALVRPTSWSRDGEVLVYHELSEDTGRDLWALERGVPRRIVASEFEERNAVLSPDGRWLAYESYRSERREVYIRPFPGPGTEITVSSGGGEPVWARDGSELYYRSENQLVAVAIEYGDTLEVGLPVALFNDDRYARSGANAASYDVAPDGRFLMLRWSGVPAASEASEASEGRLILIENFFEEFQRLVP